MAKDVSSKLVPGNDNSENTTPSSVDQQKVPPLRIVLNTSTSNHKSSSTKTSSTSNEQLKGPLRYNAKKSNFLIANNQKTGTKTNRTTSSGEQAATAIQNTSNSGNKEEDNSTPSHLSSHLRRITRRSQRSIQTVGNEEEESMSSVTSADENPNVNTSDTNVPAQESTSKRNDETGENATTTTSSITTNSTSTTTSASGGPNNTDTPRRYKRRKCDLKESTTYDAETIFNSQNYKPPVQNSFELYKSIRLQVEKKLESLHSIQPKTPHGFRDYMLNRGAYLLDGNRLGNGTNLFMNEDGGLNSRPVGKYHAFRQGRVCYSVPNRAKVPLGLPVNSPLYNLFIEQEKERYRMRIQHIKEREKLTLATEQEILRVYNRASRSAADQNEPFSACTMLKHQEVYNYLDTDGQLIQSSDDLQQDLNKPTGGRTRRRQQAQQTQQESAAPPRTKDPDDPKGADSSASVKADLKIPDANNESKCNIDAADSREEISSKKSEDDDSKKLGTNSKVVAVKPANENSTHEDAGEESVCRTEDDDSKSISSKDKGSKSQDKEKKTSAIKDETQIGEPDDNAMDMSDEIRRDNKKVKEEPKESSSHQEPDDSDIDKSSKRYLKADKSDGGNKARSESKTENELSTQVKDTQAVVATSELATTLDPDSKGGDHPTKDPSDDEGELHEEQEGKTPELNLTDDDRKAQIRDSFLKQLQEIDDKWDTIRNEMLVRHRNEAESLYAVQKLEWEWKTKEIGACDVRTTPVIDTLHVPKLNIYSQDY